VPVTVPSPLPSATHADKSSNAAPARKRMPTLSAAPGHYRRVECTFE
jgi:hypothetical protein